MVLLSLYWVLRLNPGYYIYAALSGVIPALSNDMASYTRYASLVFPSFIVWALISRRLKLSPLVLSLLCTLQLFLFLLHISNMWAG